MAKFSFGNLDSSSLFLKIGCNNDSKEYFLFAESGCKGEGRLASVPPLKTTYEPVSRYANREPIFPSPVITCQNQMPAIEIAPQPPIQFQPPVQVLPPPVVKNQICTPVQETVIEDCCEPKGYCCSSFPWPKRITVRHVVGDQEEECVPFATNYTTYEMFLAPDYRQGSIMPLIDLRGHRFDNNTYAANIGIGGRSIPYCGSSVCEMFGFNAYYDYRQGCIGYYQQVGLGIEVLGSRWDFRANAYAPFGKRRHIHTCVFDEYDGDYFAIKRDIESVSYSFNGEIGFLFIDRCDFSLYGAAGPYFLARDRCQGGVMGGEVRLRPQYKDYFALDLSWRYDSLFETIWQASIVFNLPLYQLKERNERPCGISDRQIYQPIERFEVMPLSSRTCWFSNF